MLTCELDENGFEEFGNGKCAFCGREGHDGIIKNCFFLGGFGLFFCSFVFVFLFSLSSFSRKKGDFGIETGLEREYEMHMQKMGWVSVGGRAWVWRRSGSLFDLFAALDCLQRAGLPSSCEHSSGRSGREQLRRVRVTKGQRQQ